jgi:RHS repeat-associated protein
MRNIWTICRATAVALALALAAPGAARAASDLARLAAQFEEPLVPTRPTTADEDATLAAAITATRAAAAPDDLSALEGFLADHPASGWRLALLTNLGLSYVRDGYFSRATDAFEQAWAEGRPATEPHARALADRAAGELLRLHARLGHAERLSALLDSLSGRGMSGPATEARDGARRGLWLMQNRPATANLCGPVALKNLLLAEGATPAQVAFLDNYESATRGVTLAEVARLATQAKLPYRLIRRDPGDPVPVPAIVHWKVNHFAAIVAARDGRYEIADPTFGHPHMWVTRAALDAEASGYYLVPGAQQGAGWKDVATGEAERIVGMGQTGSNDPSQTQPTAPTCQGGCNGTGGMTTYAFAEMEVSLRLTDTPVGYAPPLGPPVRVELSYNQREASQPANFSFFNVSPKWSLNWLSYIQDDPTNPGANVERVIAGGGYVDETGYVTGTGAFAPDTMDASVTSRSTSGPIVYTRTLADGSSEIYSASNGATAYPRLVFLTRITDPSGNSVNLSYDSMMRLTTITDATGRSTTFSYGLAGAPLLVTQITDPFGRAAKLGYDSSGRLSSITDVLGLTSSFAYDASSLINTLVTPYGTTSFSYGDNGNSRYLQATDPLGNTERVEYVQGVAQIPFSDPASTVPVGIIAPFNEYLNDRDTFYWDKHAYAVAQGDYTMARNRHWVHLASNTNITGGVIESVKFPFENRIWYNYPGQPNGGLGTAVSGTLNKPSTIGRVLDDGTTQLTQIAYNTLGNATGVIDPLGRTTALQYAANGVDVTTVQQTTAAGPVTTASYTYNGQHQQLSATDAAGKTTQFSYNHAGQLISSTDALGHTTSFAYNPLGYLLTVTNANGKTQVSFTYDSFGRVATRTDSEGWTVAYAYDAFDRVTQETYPDATTRTYTYKNLDLVAVKDRQGRVTAYAYDANRNLISITDPLGRVTKIGYYENGKPQSLTDPNGNVTTWAIDVQSRVTGKTYANGSGVTNTYENTTSRLRAVTDALGQTRQYSYALDNQLLGIKYLNAVKATPSVSFTYDPYFARITSMTDGSGTTGFAYYAPGTLGALKLAQETPPFANSAIAYGYDALGRLSSRSVGGDVESVTYDALGRVATHKSDLGTFQRSYVGQSAQVTSQISGLIGTRWSYDSNLHDRRLTAILNSPIASRFGYTTTPENDITAIAESRNAQTWSYTYDASDEVTKAVSSLGASFGYGYTYDPAGNLGTIQRPSTTVAVTSNTDNQIATAGGTAYKYDANGNLLQDGTRTYSWDAENRLIGIAGAGYSSSFAYDGFGRRIAITTTSGGQTGQLHYGWCGQTLCQERSAADIPMRRYLAEGEYDAVQGALVYGFDQLGSVRDVLAAPSGLTAAHFDYEPYGAPTTALGSRANWTDFRYAGLFYHQASGLYLATYRAYDPSVGRWLSRDPLAEGGGLNLYGYVQGSVLMLGDPFGLTPASAAWCFVKGAATGAAGALVVTGLAVGATALGAPVAVVTGVLGAVAIVGGLALGYDVIGQIQASNWDGLAYDIGTLGGSAAVGGFGGRGIAERINGVPSPPWSLSSDLAQGYNPNLGPVSGWLATGPNPGSAGGSVALGGAGAAAQVRGPCGC